MNRALSRRLSALVICLTLTLCAASSAQAGVTSGTSYAAAPQSTVAPYNAAEPHALHAENLYATSAILIDAGTGDVLFSKEADRILYPASTTKILTVLLALENGNLNDKVKVTSIVNTVEPTIIGLKKGETLTLGDLLHAMMLKSANDAAAVVAVHIGGSLSGFAKMMNARAQELGCLSSNFITPHGLPVKPTDNHVSTAADMAKIARAAMQNETFRKIISTREYTIAKTNKSEARKIKSTNKFLSSSGDAQFSYPYGLGVKTGYTKASGQSFVGAASRDGVELISVVLGSTADGKWEDSIKLMDYGYSALAPHNLNDEP